MYFYELKFFKGGEIYSDRGMLNSAVAFQYKLITVVCSDTSFVCVGKDGHPSLYEVLHSVNVYDNMVSSISLHTSTI